MKKYTFKKRVVLVLDIFTLVGLFIATLNIPYKTIISLGLITINTMLIMKYNREKGQVNNHKKAFLIAMLYATHFDYLASVMLLIIATIGLMTTLTNYEEKEGR